jgi:Secretion system C-terminal sorting domain/CARDB
MRKLILLTYIILSGMAAGAQVVEVSANAGTSANPALGTSNYVANESIYTEAEVGAPNFTTAATAMNRIALNVNTLGAPTTFNNVRIYFKDVPLTTTTFTTGTYTTAGYTMVFNGSVTTTATGWTEFALTTPYVRAAGTNLQMLIERTDNVAHAGFVWICANGNNTSSTINTTRRYNSTTALSGTTSLAVSAFRQAVRFVRRGNNDANVKQVYTLGKIPLPNGTPHVISANVSNDGLNALANINVTLNITGANNFTNTQVIPSLAAGASTTVSFAAFSPTVEGANNVNVSVPSDDININNSVTVSQTANKNTWSYAYGTTASGGVGFNGATGDFVAKFNTSTATSISQVTVNFFTGGQPYQIGIWDATGAGGTPGTNLYTSASLTAATGVNVIPVSPAVSIPAGDFFVGVKQTGTTNVGFAYQAETPIRSQTFYFTSPGGGTTWTDFSPSNSFRFMIEPKLILPVDAAVSNVTVPNFISCFSGPQTLTAVLSNPGANAIAPGAASVTLRVRGANTFTGTVANTTNIVSGGNETITFSGVNLPNGGTNFDTVFVTLAGDGDKTNDTLRTSNLTAFTLGTMPVIEGYETATANFGYVSILAGARNLIGVATASYTNVDLGGTLNTHGGSKMILFDNYSGASSVGVVNRLFSDCITIPAAGAGQCSPYRLSFWMSHDASFNTDLDSLYISVSQSGTNTWTRLSPGYGRYDAAFTTPGWRKETIDLSAYAGQTIQIGFENVSKYGNIIALDDITVGSTAVQNTTLNTAANNTIALQKACDDQGWTYYVDPANANQYLFGVQWDPSNTGTNASAKAAAIPKIQLDAADFAATDIPGQRATYTMKRYWNIDLAGSSLTGPLNVRFFYSPADTAAVNAAAAAFALANTGTLETPMWFKTVNTSFAGDAAHVIPDGVLNAVQLTNVNTTGITFNGVLYAQFNGITSLSGGTYAAGVGSNTPIPVDLLYFNAARNGAINTLAWATAQEINSSKFVVERSSNGGAYTAIGDVTAAGNSSNTRTYSFIDIAPVRGINLYRLRIVDKDNQFRMSWTRQVRNEGLANVSVYPNPVQDKLTVNIQADKAAAGQIIITDVNGKAVYNRAINMIQGENIIPVDAAALQSGTYFIKVLLEGDMIVRKFNKL